jgi:hypothetical protein
MGVTMAPFRPSDHCSTHLKHRGYTQRSPNYPPDKSNLLFRQHEPGGGLGKTALGHGLTFLWKWGRFGVSVNTLSLMCRILVRVIATSASNSNIAGQYNLYKYSSYL